MQHCHRGEEEGNVCTETHKNIHIRTAMLQRLVRSFVEGLSNSKQDGYSKQELEHVPKFKPRQHSILDKLAIRLDTNLWPSNRENHTDNTNRN
jgi:hypothetical protein